MTRILNNFEESFIDYPDNISIAICVIMMGCVHNCKGCQNPMFQNPEYENGTIECSPNELLKVLKKYSDRCKTNKIVLSGGDPLSPMNIDYTKELLQNNEYFDICIYTGHSIDYVKEHNVSGFKFVKCGTFKQELKRESKKTDSEMIFASPNQKLYNENYTLISEDGIYKF